MENKGNKSENKQVGLYQNKKLLHRKGNHQQNEKEKIFANHIFDKGLISKISKELMQLNSKRSEQTFFQRHSDGQQVHEKMLSIANRQGNANQNHETLPHTC